MSTARALLGILAGLSAGYAIVSLLYLTITDVGVGVAITAMCWLAIGCIRYCQRGRDKAPSSQARYSGGLW
jgi:hypothetical protein